MIELLKFDSNPFLLIPRTHEQTGLTLHCSKSSLTDFGLLEKKEKKDEINENIFFFY